MLAVVRHQHQAEGVSTNKALPCSTPAWQARDDQVDLSAKILFFESLTHSPRGSSEILARIDEDREGSRGSTQEMPEPLV